MIIRCSAERALSGGPTTETHVIDENAGCRQSASERPPLTGDFLTVMGRRVHVLTRGEGRPIVLLHGNGSLGEEILSAFPDVTGVRWIAPDRPGFGQSEALPDGRQDPASQAIWLEHLTGAMALGPFTLVAHSLSAGLALVFANARPERVKLLVLLAPFCRPTPERLLIGLRLSTVPIVGGLVRRVVVPMLVRLFGNRIIAAFTAPNDPPPWMCDLPVSHAANPRAIKSTAAELLGFNAGMKKVEGSLNLGQPVIVLHGLDDPTADPSWHLPWLRERVRDLQCVLLDGCGHAVHHTAPDLVLQAVVTGRLPDPKTQSLMNADPPDALSAAAADSRADRHIGVVTG